jgi:hypothetical protein
MLVNPACRTSAGHPGKRLGQQHLHARSQDVGIEKLPRVRLGESRQVGEIDDKVGCAIKHSLAGSTGLEKVFHEEILFKYEFYNAGNKAFFASFILNKLVFSVV